MALRLTYAVARILHDGGLSYAQIARMYGISRVAVYLKLNPEKAKMVERNPDRVRQSQARYRERNAEHLRQKRRERYAAQTVGAMS